MVSAQRIAIGAGTVIAVLLTATATQSARRPDRALNELAVMLAAAAAGAPGAVITPAMTRRLGPIRWTSASYLLAGVGAWFGVAAAACRASSWPDS